MKFLLLSFFLFSLIQCSSDEKKESAKKPDAQINADLSEEVETSEDVPAEDLTEAEKQAASEDSVQTDKADPVSLQEVKGEKETEVPHVSGPPPTENPVEKATDSPGESHTVVTRKDLSPSASETSTENPPRDREDSGFESLLEEEDPRMALADLSEEDQKNISNAFKKDEKTCRQTSISLSNNFKNSPLFYLPNVLKNYRSFVTYFSFYKNLGFFPKNSVYLETKYFVTAKKLQNLQNEKAAKVVQAYFESDQSQKKRLKEIRENSLNREEFFNQLNEDPLSFKPVLVCMALFETNWPNFKIPAYYAKLLEENSEKSDFLRQAFQNSYRLGLLDAVEKVSQYLLMAYPRNQNKKNRDLKMFLKSLNHESPYFKFSAETLLSELSVYSFDELLAEVPRRKVKLGVQSKKYKSLGKNIGLSFSYFKDWFKKLYD